MYGVINVFPFFYLIILKRYDLSIHKHSSHLIIALISFMKVSSPGLKG